MKKKIFNIFSRTSLICMEMLAVIFGLLFLAAGVMLWRLMTGPVDVGFARGYIEQALHDPVSGYSISIEEAVVEWPDWRSPLMLSFSNVDLIKNDNIVLDIEDVSLGLATRYLFIGSIKPVSIKLEQPSLNLIRTQDNAIKLSLEDEEPETQPVEEEQDPLMRMVNILSMPAGQVDDRSPLDRLQSITISNAKMVMADYLLGITWFLSPLDLTFARDPQGMIITANIALPGGRDRASHIQGDLVYLREQKDFIANIHVQDFDPHILSSKIEDLAWLNGHYAIVNGNIELGFDTSFHIHRATVSLSSMNGEVKLDGVYDAPLPFEELFVEALYDEKAGVADLKNLSIKSKGVAVNISSPMKMTSNSFDGAVSIEIPDLPQEHISPLWPDVLRGEGAEIWLTQKLSKGRFHDIKTGFDVKAEKKDDTWSINVDNIVSDFTIENMDIDYRNPLRPITQANGTGHFEDDVLSIAISDGKLGNIAVTEGTVKLDKIIEGGGMANINVHLDGPLQSVFRYIQPEPIGIGEEKLGLKVAEVKGNAKLEVNVSFPTIRNLLAEQVIVKADGTLHDVLLPDIVKTLDLNGGPFKISVADGAAQLSGKGKLDGRDIDFAWQEYINPEGKDFASQVKAEVIADKGLRDALGIALDDWIEGSFPMTVTYTEYGDRRARADVRANLGPGHVMVGPLEYKKPIGKKGIATCQVVFAGGYVREVQNLSIETEDLRVNKGRFVFDVVRGETELRQGHIPEFYLEENQLNIELEIAQSGLLKMYVQGPFLDAQPFLGDKKKEERYDGPPMLVSVNVDRMRTHPARMVDRVKIYLDMNRTGDIDRFEMDAVAGKGDIYVRLKPNDKGVMSIRLEADDAGAMLKAFDIYENVKDGKIKLYGEAKNPQERKILFGNAEMTDFNVVNAPTLAQLLNAISLFGIQQLLGGEGIYFSRLESGFEWHMNRMGDAYYFKEGRTSGSSLGLTFEGRIDKAQDLIRMEGTIVPVSFVNEVVSSIPLIGDILTGGGGGIIAATYKFEGPIKKPQVSVNPLSALAPGILRTILFE